MFLPTTLKEAAARGWHQLDFILITPDAYVDHPSFAMAILGRTLEARGFKVGILSQPRWQDPQSFLALGVPKLAFGISGGNVDSMVLNYTATKKRRMQDDYCQKGNGYFLNTEPSIKNKIRPDRVIQVYANQLKQVCKTKPVIIGGIEASLRRIAHYDYWSNSIKRSILFDSKADILVYGMGEEPLTQILIALKEGKKIEDLAIANTAVIQKNIDNIQNVVVLPSFNEVKESKEAFSKAFKLFYQNHDRQILAQQQDSRYLVQFPKKEASQTELDWIYSLPFKKAPHPSYIYPIPAFEMIKDSITAHRGCYGQCAFCSIHLHQGSTIVSRSQKSILKEIQTLAQQPTFKGIVSDIGGPSANMYQSFCKIKGCKDPNCLLKDQGNPCPHLQTGIEEYQTLLNQAVHIPKIKQVFIGSGLRFDKPLISPSFLHQVLQKHSGGSVKIAPESGCDKVLELMNKPPTRVFDNFKKMFQAVVLNHQKPPKVLEKPLVPYIIVGHPGEDLEQVKETLNFLIKQGFRGNQFQIFTPTPLTLSTAMYYLEENPLTGQKLKVEKDIKKLEQWKNILTKRS